MSLWIDIKFANLLSPQLERYKVKQTNPYVSNFRCPLCGDSKKSRTKARGNIYTRGSALYYKCFNCSCSITFGSLLKQMNHSLYDQYKIERYKEGLDIGNAAKPHSKVEFKFEAPVFEEKSILDRLLDRLDTLPESNIAVQYCMNRKIPTDKFSSLYYIDDVSRIEQLSPKYKDKIVANEPRLVIPFYNRSKKLIGVQCRALGKESLRYITINIDKSQPMIYNLDNVDTSQTVYCCEGPIDSMFIPNSVAIGSSDLKKISSIIPKHNIVLVFDNQPRNVEILKLMRSACSEGYNMVIWPDNIEQKDINEMIMCDISQSEILDAINKNTFSNLSLRLKLNTWGKC